MKEPHPVEFGRWLLKYCMQIWEDGLLAWKYQGKVWNTLELYQEFLKQK